MHTTCGTHTPLAWAALNALRADRPQGPAPMMHTRLEESLELIIFTTSSLAEEMGRYLAGPVQTSLAPS